MPSVSRRAAPSGAADSAVASRHLALVLAWLSWVDQFLLHGARGCRPRGLVRRRRAATHGRFNQVVEGLLLEQTIDLQLRTHGRFLPRGRLILRAPLLAFRRG